MNRFRPVALAAIAAVRRPLEVADPFADVRAATRRHRRAHPCGAFAYGEGSLPAAIVAAVGAGRIVEVGTALGYTALAMAHVAPGARVETIEIDPDHVRLAREQISAHRVVRELRRLLRIGGTLIAGNLILGPGRAVTSHLGNTSRRRTHSFGETALCVRLA
ncbi:O-methyltransferase [Streptomyces griseofuscus]|uniref:hypothetical protein n=1 Tax=Streptomyces griseofuscus TaxID=146922 RepID=UPI00382A03A4